MKIRKLLAAALVLVMVLAAIPVVSLAEGVNAVAYESRQMSKLDKTWAVLDAAEAKAIAAGMNRTEVIQTVYQAALNIADVDTDSFSDFSRDGFFFTVDGMYCAYNYRLRNELTPNYDYVEDPSFIPGTGENKFRAPATRSTCGTAGSPNVLLVGPYYSSDSSFTDQYKNEAQSIANATGGSCTQLINANATGPAIAAAYPGKGVIIYDSHGTQSGTSSYLCLTTNTGITTTDYNNGWAVSSGSAAFIDGRYIQNHISGSLSNPFVWMAICEGMKKAGKGTTGTALLAAGCGGVYGYSQSVSFTGDYKYETVFWNQMKNGADVKTAIAAMKNQYGVPDPVSGGDAYPIVMSALDSFPSNPDANQTVYCDWTMIGASTPDPITSVTVDNITVAPGETAQVNVTVAPSTADYTITSYSSSNTSVATVSSAGVVTGVAAGTATLTVKVKDNSTSTTYTKTATITVAEFEGYKLVDSVEVGQKYIIIESGSISGTTGYAVGNSVVANSHYLNGVAVTVNSNNTLTIPSGVNANAITWVAGGSASAGYTWKNVANSKYMGLDSSEYLYPSDTAVNWLYDSNKYFNNQTDSEGYYYLSCDESNSNRYTTSKSGTAVYVYKLFTSSTTPDPTAAPTAVPTAAPTAAPTAVPTAAPTAVPTAAPTAEPTAEPTAVPEDPTGTYYVPATTITEGEEYLIGYNDGSNVYLLMNYNPNTSNHYYYNSSSNYYGYGVKAVMSGSNVVGVDTSTYSGATLDYVGWKFVANGSYYKIQSAYNSSYYLRVYSSTSYADCYPASGTSYATNWSYSGNKLSYYVSSSVTKYISFVSGGYFAAKTSGASSLTLYKKVSGSVTPTTYYTVTFKDWDGTVLKTQQVEAGGAATAPANPSREGYTFAGWDKSFSYITADTIVTATYTQNSTEPTGTYYVPTTTIETGVEYLIGYTDGTNTYVLMNYNPDQSNHYYLNSSSNYYGYAVRAVMDGSNVVGIDNTTFTTATLDHVGWKFVANGSYYKIQSAYNSSYYLRVYSSSSYADCYPASGTSYATKWQYTGGKLSYYVSSSLTKYATFYSGAADDYGFFGATTSGSSIVLFKKVTRSAAPSDYVAPVVELAQPEAIVPVSISGRFFN